MSSVGKALGSLVAMRVEHGAKHAAGDADRADAVTDRLSGLKSGFEKRVVGVAETYGYAGLTLLLSVPLMPDTATVYAFGVLELDDPRSPPPPSSGACSACSSRSRSSGGRSRS